MTDLIGACDNARKVPPLLILPFDNGFDDTRVIRAEIYKDVCDARLRLVNDMQFLFCA